MAPQEAKGRTIDEETASDLQIQMEKFVSGEISGEISVSSAYAFRVK